MSDKTLDRVLVVGAVLLLAIPCVYAIGLIRSLGSFSDAYATDWTSTFVIDHLRTSGEWPRDWDDLRDEYDRFAPATHYAWTFEELQTRVSFDFTADVDVVRDADPPLEVFRLTSGKVISFNGDPNELIRTYLRTGEDPWRVDPPIGRNVDARMPENDERNDG